MPGNIEQSASKHQNKSKHLCLAVLAHVDAGKTTLSEAMLCQSGAIRKTGRVDNKDSFLDYVTVERARGITVYSKQAVFWLGDRQVTLLDTPGHVDFSAETERALRVADCAVLLISGPDGVQSHTETLWRLLEYYNIPCFIFVNKMDREGTDRANIMRTLHERLDSGLVDFTFSQKGGIDESGHMDDSLYRAFLEDVAACDENVLESYLNTGTVTQEQIQYMVSARKLYPVFFGSALKLFGVAEFMEGLSLYAPVPVYGDEFGAKVYKITRDASGKRLTHMKITSGTLRVRDVLQGKEDEKVTQIRLYSGEKYDTLTVADAGSVVAVLGPFTTYPGQGLGTECDSPPLLSEPVLRYRMILPPDCDVSVMLSDLKQLEEEIPELSVTFEDPPGEIQLKVMGAVQIEVLKGIIEERFKVSADFGAGHIVYKEDLSSGVLHILEPFYHFRLKIPTQNVGKAMSDLEQRSSVFEVSQTDGTFSVITGKGPVATLWDYAAEVTSYAGGRGSFTCSFAGYEACHNEKEILRQLAENQGLDPDAYDSFEDSEGWEEEVKPAGSFAGKDSAGISEEEELERIFARTYGEPKARAEGPREVTYKPLEKEKSTQDNVTGFGKPGYLKKNASDEEEYLLVDGYNIIHAWKELNELSKTSLDSARQRLMDILSNYQGLRSGTLILVFDAYKVPGNPGSTVRYNNIYVVYTKEAEIADAYIEKLAHRMGRKYRVTVATSDGLEQLIIRGQGCYLMTASDLLEDVKRTEEKIREDNGKIIKPEGNTFFSGIDEETAKSLKEIHDQGSPD